MKIHIVQKGDTLWEIAKMYGVDFEQLKQANTQLSSPDMVMPGMKIKVPSTSKSVKKDKKVKEKPVKEMKVKEEKTEKSKPKKPITMNEGDEKEKKKEIKPEMPLPQMPQTPTIPEYPIMKMPTIEQEMNNYTMINIPQMPQTPQAKEETKKTPSPKKPIEKKETKKHKEPLPPKIPEQAQTPPQQQAPPPVQEMEGHFTHMCPVCCHSYMPVFHMPPMMEGCCGQPPLINHMGSHHFGHPPMGDQHYGHQPIFDCMPTEAPGYGGPATNMPPHQPKNECGCEENTHQAHYSLQPKPTIELTDKKDTMNHYPQTPHHHTENYYPTPPPFRDQEEE